MTYLMLAALLAGAGAGGGEQKPARPPADPNKQICKQSATIGSLIPGRRECHTRAEWDRVAEQARADGQRMQDQSRTGGGGPQ